MHITAITYTPPISTHPGGVVLKKRCGNTVPTPTKQSDEAWSTQIPLLCHKQ